jgi:replicative DNA helicase
MNVEDQLVSAIAKTQSMEAVLKCDLQPHHFLQRKLGDTNEIPLPGEVYAWMLHHLREFRNVPSIDLVRARWPKFEIVESTDSVGALLEYMIRLVNYRLACTHARFIADLAEDPTRIGDLSTHVFEAARELARAVPSSGVTKFSDALTMLDLYKQREATGDTPGISTGMQWLDDLTYGIQPKEMIIIEGFLGTGKSSHAIKMCADAYFLRDQTPMFFSFEMEGDKLVQRWISICAGFKYSALKRLELNEGDLKKWYEIGLKAEKSKFDKDVLVIDDEFRPTSDFIFGKVEQWNPDFAIVDTIDEVRAPMFIKSHWEKQDHAARELKGIARATKVPMVVIAQAGRGAEEDGATLGNIAGSITIARKADIALGIHATDSMKKSCMCEYRLLKNRDDGGEGTVKNMYRDHSTNELREWVANDAVPKKAVA